MSGQPRGAYDAGVELGVLGGHAVGAETSAGTVANACAVEPEAPVDGGGQVAARRLDRSRHALLDDLGRSTDAEGGDGRAGHHGLDLDEPERLRSQNRVEQSARAAEQRVALCGADQAHVLDGRAVDARSDYFVEVLVLVTRQEQAKAE